MSKSYTKACDYYKQKIEMSDKDGGRWPPYNLDNGPHNCRNGNGKDKDKGKKKQVTLEMVQKKLESIGITIDVKKLMNEPTLKDVIETIDNPFDIGESFLGIDTRASGRGKED